MTDALRDAQITALYAALGQIKGINAVCGKHRAYPWQLHCEDCRRFVAEELVAQGVFVAALGAPVPPDDDLLAALKGMVALVEKLWPAVDWGKTFNLPVRELNEAPIAAKRAIANAEAVRGLPPQAPTAGPKCPVLYAEMLEALAWMGKLAETDAGAAIVLDRLRKRVNEVRWAHPEQHTEGGTQ
jgi:hypothetical protein